MKINYITQKFPHHSSNSGYFRTVEGFDYEKVTYTGKYDKITPNRLHWRLRDYFTEKRPLANYDFGDFLVEIESYLWGHLPGVRLNHYLYADHALYFSALLPRKKNSFLAASFHHPPSYHFTKVIEKKNNLRFLQSLDLIQTLNKEHKEYFSQYADPNKIIILPHGVDTSFFKPNSEIEKKKECLFVGSWLRDIDLLSKIIELTCKLDDSIKFNVVTNKDNINKLKNLKNTNFFDGISDEQLLKLYQSSRLLVLPLLDCTANNALLEAMSCGLPVITTKVGGALDYTTPHGSMLISGSEAENYVEKIISLSNDRFRLEEMSYYQRKYSQNFSWENIKTKQLSTYKDFFYSSKMK